MKNRFLLPLLALLLPHLSNAQTAAAIDRVNPTNWWVGMKNPGVQVLIHGPGAGTLAYTISYPGVKLVKSSTVENPNYAFLDLVISPTAKPGRVQIIGKKGSQTVTQTWEIRARDKAPKGQGVTDADFIYCAMIDRFANGDPANDKFADLRDTNLDRANPFFRHGGDLAGVAQHFPYLKELGATAVWLTPVTENDQPLTNEGGTMRASYHGFGFTDQYQVDRRFGGNAGYKRYVQQAHAAGLKVVQDVVYNHVGNTHWILQDLPMKSWLHQWPTYTNTTYKYEPITDPHAALSDRRVTLDGWFVPFLPDLNQQNPYVANYLIENALWNVENFGIDAYRIDTYLYNDQPFMNRCNAALLAEYPRLHIFGESAVHNVVDQAYYTRNKVDFPFKSNQPGGLDFVLEDGLLAALKEVGTPATTGWDGGPQHLYQTLAKDGVYENPNKLVTFLDNFDHNRYLSEIGDDLDRYKLGLTWLLTTRGIPSMYYGTEILMKNFKDPTDAEVRKDFPGGWPGDKEDKFTPAGRSARENEAFDFVKKLAIYRRDHPALHAGKLMQYLPENGLYVYFRYDASGTVMVASNTTDKPATLPTARFMERMSGFSKARNVMTGESLSSVATLQLPAKTAVVLELLK